MARLPIVGGDTGNWGTILNEFLEVSLNGDGTIQAAAVIQAGTDYLAPDGLAGDVTGALSTTAGYRDIIIARLRNGKWRAAAGLVYTL
jgi:hypothetical protein